MCQHCFLKELLLFFKEKKYNMGVLQENKDVKGMI